ncbi:copper resistance CopC family protein [Mycobacterium sp. BMJ-28]
MRTRLAALLTAVLAVASLAGAGAASAHAVRVSSDPAADAVLAKGPDRITATFNEQLQTAFASMTLVGPDGNLWSTGEARVQGPAVQVDLRPLGPAGTYTANYRVTSADGHVVSGSWSFRLSVAGAGTPGPPVAAPQGSGGELPVWPFAVLAVAIVGAGVWWSRRRRT